MAIANYQLLNTTAAGSSDFLNISKYGNTWSLHVVGLETGGSIQVRVSNSLAQPAADDANAVVIDTIQPGSNHAAFYVGSTPANWLQLVKVAGGSPTATTVNVFAPSAS